MKRWILPRSLGAAIALILTLAAQLAADEKAVLAGRVADPAGRPLVGAALELEGTHQKTRTNAEGAFLWAGLPAGSRVLRVSYLGYADATMTVELAAGQRLEIELRLAPELAETLDVVAAPIMAGQARALNEQRTAVNIVNLVAADQIGRFPDANAAEAAQRIPGVTLERDQGEGRYVIVRGTEPRLSSMMVNGERLPSTEGDIRNVAIDVVPADLLQAIELSKALTPDMDGDAIGGAVNLVTQKAPDSRRAGATLGTGYNDQSGGVASHGQLVLGGRAEQGWGWLLAGSFSQNNRGSDNFEVDYDDGELEDLELRDYTVRRDRTGFNLSVDRALAENSEIYAQALWNELGDQEFRRRFRSQVGDDALDRQLKDRFETQAIARLSLGGHHLVGTRALIDYRLVWADSEEDQPEALETSFVQEDVEFAPNVSAESIDPNNIQSHPLNEDLDAYEFDEMILENGFTSEEDRVLAVDITLPSYREGGSSALWKFGAKGRFKEKNRNVDVFELDPGDLRLGDLLDRFKVGKFLDGRYQVGPFPDARTLREAAATADAERVVEEDLADYDAEEDTLAAYLSADLSLGPSLALLLGGRYERTEATYRGFGLVFDEDGELAELTERRGGNDSGNFLPMAHLRWAIDERSNLRVALTRSLARPSFFDLVPYELLLAEDREIERGNPELEVTTSWNFDVLYERYFGSVGVFSVGVFAKDLDRPIFYFVFDEERGGEDFEVTQPRNGAAGEVRGLELAWQQNFQPSGLGIYFNLTLTDSEAQVPGREDQPRLPGQAEQVGNLALSYEKAGFSGRLSLNYHNEYLFEVADEAATDLWVDEHLQLDLAASQEIRTGLRLYLELNNLTDEPYRVYQGSTLRPIQEEYYSFWGSLGLKLEF